jgi:predicted metal-dependent peptidase
MSINKLSPQEKRINAARYYLISNGKENGAAFYASLALHLYNTVDPNVKKTVCDAKEVKWNPEYVDSLSDEQVRYVLLQNALHCGYGHPWRFEPSPKANLACDLAVNLQLNELKNQGVLIDMPSGEPLDQKYKGMAEEVIYKMLPDFPPDKQPKPGCADFSQPAENGEGEGESQDQEGEGDGRGGGEGDKEGDGKGKGQSVGKRSLREEWEANVYQAQITAKNLGQGTMPADMDRYLKERLAPRIDWRQELAEFVKNSISVRNDWTRSSRRNAWQPVIMPRKRRDEVATVVIVRDTSGSISDDIIGAFNSVIESAISEVGVDGFLIDCDARIAAEYEIGPGIPLPQTAKGGGGTDFREPFLRVKELQEEGKSIAGLIYLTDTFGSTGEAPDFPTLWLSITKDAVMPFGRTVYVEI